MAESDEGQDITAGRINAVQSQQAKSISQGVKLGKLTPKELKKLTQEQDEISMLEETMRANGSLNTQELRELFKRLERSRKHINQLLRNSISTCGESEQLEGDDNSAKSATH
ncbi:MAG: hypothetical protein CSB47_02340 [Proteobacteria bacterium]|nr:MAG: hypothetical protein CSB47_02340 [Pseudomonadota bacterium]